MMWSISAIYSIRTSKTFGLIKWESIAEITKLIKEIHPWNSLYLESHSWPKTYISQSSLGEQNEWKNGYIHIQL
jgi:hypothetical protein